jgi:ubiquitin C-terminal hydrolase
VIHIIRTGYHPKDGPFKVMDRVRIDEQLEMSKHTTPADDTPVAVTPMADDEINIHTPLRYKLHGVVSHNGKFLNGGHYVATVRCQNGVDFARINDLGIKDAPSERQKIINSADGPNWQSYIVMYQKFGGKMANCI